MVGIFLPFVETVISYLANGLVGAGELDAVKSMLRTFGTVKRGEVSALAWAIVVGSMFFRGAVVTRRFVDLWDRLVRHETVNIRVLKVDDVLSHKAPSILASTFLSNGSWAAGKLAGDALLALDDVGERSLLSAVWGALTWLLIVDVWGVDEWAGTIVAALSVLTCFCFVQGSLRSYSPFSSVSDLACGMIVACVQGGAVVIVGNAKTAYVGLMAGLSVWIALNASFYLPISHQNEANMRVPISQSGRLQALRDFLNMADLHGVDLRAAGFSDAALLELVTKAIALRTVGQPALEPRLVDLVINQLTCKSRQQLRKDALISTFRSLTYDTSVGIRRNFGYGDFAELSFFNPQNRGETRSFEEISVGLVPNVAGQGVRLRRCFLVPNVQRPTIPIMDDDDLVPIIVGRADLETADGNGDIVQQEEGTSAVPIQEILAVQPYRHLRLLAVRRVDRESYGPLRSKLTCSMEIYLLTVVIVLALGATFLDLSPRQCKEVARCSIRHIFSCLRRPGQTSKAVVYVVGKYDLCQGGWDRVLSIASAFCLVMCVGPPADYSAFPRVVEVVSAKFPSCVGHISGRGFTSAYRLAWWSLAMLADFASLEKPFTPSEGFFFIVPYAAMILCERVLHDSGYCRSAVPKQYVDGAKGTSHRNRSIGPYQQEKSGTPGLYAFIHGTQGELVRLVVQCSTTKGRSSRFLVPWYSIYNSSTPVFLRLIRATTTVCRNATRLLPDCRLLCLHAFDTMSPSLFA